MLRNVPKSLNEIKYQQFLLFILSEAIAKVTSPFDRLLS